MALKNDSIDVQALREAYEEVGAGDGTWRSDYRELLIKEDDGTYYAGMLTDSGIGHLVAQLLNQMPAICDEIEELRQAQQWQPISTAPKDGTWVLLLVRQVYPTSTYALLGCWSETAGMWNCHGGWRDEKHILGWHPIPPPPAKEVTE